MSESAVSAVQSNASDSSAGECFTVTPVTPTLATTARDDVSLGDPVTDSAALTGASGPAAGGTITFKLYGPNDCTTLAYTSAAVAVSGNGTYNTPAPQSVPSAAGTYYWVAEYSGNLPNTNATNHKTACTDANEDVVANAVAPSLTSAQTWVPNDSVTVSAPAAGGLAGTVSFALYPRAPC